MGGVGGGVLFPVPPKAPPGPPPGAPREQGRPQAHQNSRQPGGHKIQNVVQFRGGRAKILVLRGAVAHHGVQGAHRLERHAQGQTAQKEEDQGGDHPVAGVLRHRLHRRLGHPAPIQDRGVPAHDPGDGRPGPLQVAGFQGGIHRHGLHLQVPGGQELEGKPHLHPPGQPGRGYAAQPEEQDTPSAEQHRHQQDQRPPGDPLPCMRLGKRPAQERLQGRDGPPHPPHRVGQPPGVPQNQVQEHRREEHR